MKDTLHDVAAYRELIQKGGRSMVPCLRIQQDNGNEIWLYESLAIIDYLDTQSN